MFNIGRGRFGLPPVVFNLLVINVVMWLVVQLAMGTKNPAVKSALPVCIL